MLMSAPVESTFAALLVLAGITYTANSIFNYLIKRAHARRAVLVASVAATTETGENLVRD